MAQQQVQFAKRSSGTSAILAKTANAPEEETKVYPLALRPLLTSNRRLSNVSIRLERVPQRARLSAGQNNGDRSWSLTLDELDGLTYLLPADLDEPHSLSVRVIDRVDGATVTVLEYKIPPEGAPSKPAATGAASPSTRPAPADDGALRALRDELADTKAALSTALADSEERARQIERDWTLRAREMVDDALSKARTEWDTEFSGRLKSIAERAEQTLVQRRQAWQAELDARVADAARQAEDSQALARESWQREADAALAKAQANWRSAEAARLSAAEARWKDEVAAAQAETRTHASQSERGSAELTHLREQLSIAKHSLEDLAREVQNARADAARAKESARVDAEAALATAKKTWELEEAAKLASAKAAWREQSDAALAEAAARQERAEKAREEAERRAEHLARAPNEAAPSTANAEVAELRAKLAAGESVLAQAREQAEREAAAKLTQARERWKLEDEARLAAAEARWREQSNAALAEETARRQRAEASLADAHGKAQAESLQRAEAKFQALREQVDTLQSALENRDAELRRTREQSQRVADAALAQARKEWETGETARLADAQARWRAESAQTLEEATRRCEAAEQQLSEARSQRDASPQERVETLRLRDEIERLRINLELKDIELRQVRSAGTVTPPYGAEEIQINPLPRGRMAMKADASEEREASQKGGRSLVRDIALVAAGVFLLALAPLSRPYLEPMLPYSWQDSIDSTFGDLDSTQPSDTAPSKPQPKAAPQPIPTESQTDVVLRTAKLHAKSSTTSPVIATLPRDTQVSVIEQQGNWVHVSAGGQQGWIYGTYLQAEPAGTPTP